MNKNNSTSPAVKLLILGVVFGLPIFFVLANKGTALISDVAPYAIIVVMAVAAAFYSVTTANLLYKYYETSAPWYAWLPCVGELTLMDGKFTKIGLPIYGAAIVFGLLAFLPYSVTSVFGESIGLHFPVFMMMAAMICLAAIQVVKGIGLLGCMKVVSDEWKEHTGSEVGFIKYFAFLGFIPFVRVMATYSLNKPLSTLVQFNNVTVSDSTDIDLTEEE